MRGMKRAITIAGSDPTGAAGIQGDLKTFFAFKVYGTAVVTAVTAQDSRGLKTVLPVDPATLRQGLRSAFFEVRPNTAKVGMVYNADIIREVALALKEAMVPFVVIDPMMVASRGGRLLEEDAISAFKEELIPLATLLTPNLSEAEILSGVKIESSEDMAKAARRIEGEWGCQVLVKGGHLRGEALDILYDGREFREFSLPRLDREVHGTGCALSAGIAAGLALGLKLPEAIKRAKDYVWRGMKEALPSDGGMLLFNHDPES